MSMEKPKEKFEEYNELKGNTKKTDSSEEGEDIHYRGFSTLTYDEEKRVWTQPAREDMDEDMSVTEMSSVADSGIEESVLSYKSDCNSDAVMPPDAVSGEVTVEKSTPQDPDDDNVNKTPTSDTEIAPEETSNLENSRSPNTENADVETASETQEDGEITTPVTTGDVTEDEQEELLARKCESEPTESSQNKKTAASSRLWVSAKIRAAIANSFIIWRDLDEKAADLARSRWKKAHKAAVLTNALTPFREVAEQGETIQAAKKIARVQDQLSVMKRSFKMYQFQAVVCFIILIGILGIMLYRCMTIYQQPQPWSMDHIFVYAYCATRNIIEQM